MKSNQFLIAGVVAALLPFAAAVAQDPPSQSPPQDPTQSQPQAAPAIGSGLSRPRPSLLRAPGPPHRSVFE